MCSASYIDHTLRSQVYGRDHPLLSLSFGFVDLRECVAGSRACARNREEPLVSAPTKNQWQFDVTPIREDARKLEQQEEHADDLNDLLGN